MYGEEFEKVGVFGYLGIPSVPENALQEIMLLVVVGGQDDEVDDALKDLGDC